MSWIKGIIGGAIGAEAATLVKDYIEKQGGLEAVVKQFESSGFANKIRSWVSTGQNLPINAIEIQQALGLDKLSELARKAGLPVDKVRDTLAEYLPMVIDKATPEGRLPPPDKA